MSLTVILPRRLEANPISLETCATISEAIDKLENRVPNAFNTLFQRQDGQVQPRPYIVTFLNGEMVTDFGLRPGLNSELLFATAFSGG